MEQYVKQPLAVEVFDLGDKTDIILRRDIQAWWDYDPTEPEDPDDFETRIMAAFADAIRGGVNGV